MTGPLVVVALLLTFAFVIRLVALNGAVRSLRDDAERRRRETDRIVQRTEALRAQNESRRRAMAREAARPVDPDPWANHHASECVNARCPRHGAKR
jgi:cell division protein FtsB